MIASLLALTIAATLDVGDGLGLPEALSRARSGDVIRLPAAVFEQSLGALRGVRVVGAGEGRTSVLAPEGKDGVTLEGDASVEELSLVAPAERCAAVSRSGKNLLRGVGLSGGACGLRVLGGSVDAERVDANGRQGVVVSAGVASLHDGSARGEEDSIAILGGSLGISDFAVDGPCREAALLAAGGSFEIEDVVVRAPGLVGLSVARGARVRARRLDVVGGGSTDEFATACVLSQRGDVEMQDSLLVHCGGVAFVAAGGRASLRGVDAAGASSGCFQFLQGAHGTLSGDTCVGRGPGLLVAGGSDVAAGMNVWSADPVRWVECSSGSRLELGPGERGPRPCTGSKAAERSSPLDKRPPP